ncbi:DUF58 domain-containing protein [Sphaerospermopsis aphanizomenoides BCCUSP55]|uniref:DUF58 domain-containing protein n=1 Tax=Sphaerospermopsis aphanizomenoides TaxID=459663 RepID=UPI001907F499|nr:DUF58 domain-containing protein [Sphaerospermopsis aphanizomenoides]MBK1986725.1 DUF58 domain-containing protein [Sphaerospermopsis aphanizomenoides BCCUSP55]
MQKFIYQIYHFSSALQHKLAKRITINGFAVILCLIFSAALGLDTTQNLTYQIFTFLVSILIIATVCSRFFRSRVSAIRTLPRFATVGVKLKYKIVIHNKTNQKQTNLKLLENFSDPRPTWKEFLETPEPEEHKRTPLDIKLGSYRWLWLVSRKQCGTAKTIELPPLKPHSKIEVLGEITPTHRGVMRLVSMTIARPDPFGLFNACKTISLPQSLLILPKLYQLPPIQLPGLRKYQSGGVALASSVGDAEEFHSLREYRPGDSLRKIHWKSWAKIGKPIVKEEQDEFFVRHALILDTFQPEKYSQILEEAISIAASLASEMQTQESLLDLMFVGNEAYCFTFGRGLSSTEKMLEILASVVACQHKYFDSLIPVVLEKISLLSGCICIFISWDDQRKKLVEYLNNMGIHTLVLILTNNEDQFNHTELMSYELVNFQILNINKIQQELMQL